MGLANAIVTPIGRKDVWVPYIGGGLGFANTDSKINSLTFGGTTINDSASNSETNLAQDAIVGVDFLVVDGFALGGRYQYLWVNSSWSFTGRGVTQNEGNFGASILTAQVTYKF